MLGSPTERTLKKIQPLVAAISALEPRIEKLSDAQLLAKTAEFREKLAQGAPLDDLLIEAFAVVREASRRTTKMRHFDVQLVGGVVLHRGMIAEMKTGEGKTLVATLPAYLNALDRKGVHIVTVNDYLAKRDTEWMGAIYRFLGLTVGTIQHDLGDAERQAAYRSDITYGTNNEFGFDYLRDNMKFRLSDLVQREFNYAIVDEVDSILIDEARTPLIISGPTQESTALYYKVDSLVRRLHKEKDFTVDEKTRTVSIIEAGVAEAERMLGISNLYDLANMDLVHAINTSLKAHHLFKRDVDYMIQDGKVVIVDEFTGRLMPGRRYSDGLHQALEAKERVRVEEEYQTLAQITFQNYFRMFKKLAGMTGTAVTEAEEFGPPNSRSCSSSERKPPLAWKRGRKPASANAAFARPNGLPGFAKVSSSAYVRTRSSSPKSIERITSSGRGLSLAKTWMGGWPFKSAATFKTLPPCSMQ